MLAQTASVYFRYPLLVWLFFQPCLFPDDCFNQQMMIDFTGIVHGRLDKGGM